VEVVVDHQAVEYQAEEEEHRAVEAEDQEEDLRKHQLHKHKE
jgi:hypothetical protein